MKSFVFLSLFFSTFVNVAFATGIIARSAKCDVGQIYSVLEALSTGSAFCSSYNHISTADIRTKTTTVKATGVCSTITKTQTVHATLTNTVYGKTTTLPTITVSIYSSTVLIPSGTVPPIDKRSAASTTSSNTLITPTVISDCSSRSISAACLSLVGCQTTTITVTSTDTKKCTATTVLSTTITDRTTTTKIPVLISPAPIVVSPTGVLTTTVPAVCASTPYYPNGNGDGNQIIPLGYPYFPQTQVECCVICFQQENCIASATIYADDENTLLAECDLLIHVNGTQSGVSGQCPLGVQDYPFGPPEAGGNVYPGPCGH